MSLFTTPLFLQDFPARARIASDDEPRNYAQGYGNRIASARVFAPLGHASHGNDHRKAGAPLRPVAAANDCWARGACA